MKRCGHKLSPAWRRGAAACLGLFGGVAAVVSGAAQNPLEGDIRNLKVGVSVATLATDGYTGFSCLSGKTGGAAEPPAGWRDWRRCAANPAGLVELGFRYDDDVQQWAAVNDKWEGTKLAGHPVRLSVLVDGDGVVRTIRAVTDPDARAYLRKKAYLLGLRVKARYGRDGWACEREQPGAGRQPIGGVYVNERCRKDYQGRRLTLQTQLFRSGAEAPAASLDEVTSLTRLEISAGAGTL